MLMQGRRLERTETNLIYSKWVSSVCIVFCLLKSVMRLPPSDAVRRQKKYFGGSFWFSIVTIQKISPPPLET